MILLCYTDNYGILLGDGESRYEPWDSSIWGRWGWYSSWYVISIDTGHNITQKPQSDPRWSPAFKMEPVLFGFSFTLRCVLPSGLSVKILQDCSHKSNKSRVGREEGQDTTQGHYSCYLWYYYCFTNTIEDSALLWALKKISYLGEISIIWCSLSYLQTAFTWSSSP